MKNKIELSYCLTGDWVKMIINNNVVYEGHSIPDFIWLDVLEDTGFEVLKTEYPYEGEE
jgi:hypothetical protein